MLKRVTATLLYLEKYLWVCRAVQMRLMTSTKKSAFYKILNKTNLKMGNRERNIFIPWLWAIAHEGLIRKLKAFQIS